MTPDKPTQAAPGSTDEYEQWRKDGSQMPAQAGQVLTNESRRIARLQALSEQVHAHNTVYERKGADLHAAAPPAQAELLTDATLLALWSGDDSRPVLGKNKVLAFARAIEQAVLAKRVPMTREAVKVMMDDSGYTNAPAQARADFINGIRHAERHHGIGGEKGGA